MFDLTMVDDPSQSNESPELWRHSHPEETQFYAFQQHVKQKFSIVNDDYHSLWQWSVDHPAAFWEEIWHYTGLKSATPYERVRLRVPRSYKLLRPLQGL